jgi:hypothetical protein
MENISPQEASAALADAEAARTRLTGALRLPSHFHLAIGAAIAVQIGTGAAGLTGKVPLLIAGVAVFVLVAGVQLARFRRLNGVWLGGLASRVVFGTANASSLAYTAGLTLAAWAAFRGWWWLVVVAAIGGGAGYAASGRHWLRVYRADPAAHGRGEPAWQLAALGAVVVVGLVFLLIGH